MTRRPTALVAACATAALALVGCGGSDKPTIPHDEGATLIRHLQKARDAAGDPAHCDDLQRAVAAAQADVQSLPSSVDKDTRDSLVNGVNNLQDTARSECENVQTTDTTTTETTPPTTTETTPPTTTETAPPTTTTQTTPPTTQTQTTPPTSTEPTPGNGNGNSGGTGPGSAPGQNKPGKKPKELKPGKAPK